MATQYQNGGWYDGRQAWNGVLGAPGVINNPNQQGYQQAVSPEVNRQSSVAQGKAPNAIQDYLYGQTQRASLGGGASGNSLAGGGASGGVFDIANSLLSFQQNANKPIVSALQKQGDVLTDRYSNLLATIKGKEQKATNQQTVATNTELGNRGIGPDSGLYQQTLTNALNPITEEYSRQTKEATTSQSADATDLALRIAQAQSGDPLAAISGAINISGQNSGGNQSRYVSIGNGLYDTQTGQIIQNSGGGGNLPDLSSIFQ